MKYDIQFTNQFKKDLKLAKKQNKNLDKLFEVIGILANGGTLDAKYRDHDLTGNNDNRPETLLAVVDAAAAERVVRLASPVIQGKTTIPVFLICSCVAYLYSFPESQFVSLLYFQQFPYVSHSVFQLGNIGIIETPGAVDAAADVVDICGNPADGSSQLFLLIQADFFADGSCAVWYDKTLLSLLNGHFLLKTW